MKISFIHSGNVSMGSYRLRAQLPAQELGWSINDLSADVFILSKPMAHEIALLDCGRIVIADFCDPHFARFSHYREILKRVTAVTCSSQIMAQIIASMGREATVIGDCWDSEQEEPHFNAVHFSGSPRLMWFGHRTNVHSIKRLLPQLCGYTLRVLCNAEESFCEPLTDQSRKDALAWADIVVLPETESYKNPNRAVTAMRAGCFVVAEPHPAYVGLPIYVGDIKEGIQWAQKNPQQALELVRKGQDYVCERYSPKTVASAWKKAIQSVCTSGAENTAGPVGITAISPTLTQTATFANYPSPTTMLMPPLPSTLLNISTSGK